MSDNEYWLVCVYNVCGGCVCNLHCVAFFYVPLALWQCGFMSLPPAAMSGWDCTALLYLVLFKLTGSFCFITFVPLLYIHAFSLSFG